MTDEHAVGLHIIGELAEAECKRCGWTTARLPLTEAFAAANAHKQNPEGTAP